MMDSKTTMSFPEKLHFMLNEADRLEFNDIVCWQPGGKSFKVLQPQRFSNEIMKIYFNQTKYKSFQRQLNIYGFRRVPHGPNKGGYIHPQFERNAPDRFQFVIRRSKALLAKLSTAAAVAAKVLPPVESSRSTNVHRRMTSVGDITEALMLDESDVKDLFDMFRFSDNETDVMKFQSILEADDIPYESDSSSGEEEGSREGAGTAATVDSSDGSCNDNCTFPFKLHLMLDYAERESLEHVVSWVGGGSAFKVHDCKAFVEQIMPQYFDQTKYESFRRQLNLYGFRRVGKGEDRGIISHANFVKGRSDLCHNIFRKNAPPAVSECSSSEVI